MLASLKLLNRFVSLPTRETDDHEGSVSPAFDTELLAEILTRQGFEVESISQVGQGLDAVVVGQIDDAKPHPQADRLKVCRVNVGASAPRQIVCGAPNARAGLHVAVALPGAQLPGGLEIAETTIRGIESRGMLCARDELGLAQLDSDGDGIWELAGEGGGEPDLEFLKKSVGEPLFRTMGLSDVLFDLSVTPNRPDGLSHEGVAREVFVGLERMGKKPVWHGLSWLGEVAPRQTKVANPSEGNLSLPEAVRQCGADLWKSLSSGGSQISFSKNTFHARNELGVPCFFVGIEAVEPRPSPVWLRGVLESLGQNSVNDVVDLSNLVLLLVGQPSHAFDLEKISGGSQEEGKLTLRQAREGEAFVGLDGKKRQLAAEDCVVADATTAQALLGVIGGDLSKVDLSSRSLVLEVANPDPVAVRRTSRRIGRKTDSSFQFEKGVDRAARLRGAALFVELLQRLQPQAQVVGAVPSFIDLEKRPEGAFVWSREKIEKEYGGAAGTAGAENALVPAFDLFCRFSEFPNEGLRSEQSLPEAAKPLLWQRGSLHKIVGVELIPWSEQISLLQSLGFGLAGATPAEAKNLETVESLSVTTPHWRWHDVAGEADLAEEIVRVVGIDQVPGAPIEGVLDARRDDEHFAPLESLAGAMAHLGYTEVTSFHFMREDDLRNLGLSGLEALGQPVRLLNPIIQDEPLLHTTLIPDLLRKVRRNLNYGVKMGTLFHICRTYQDLNPGAQSIFSHEAAEPAEELLASCYSPARGMSFSQDEGAGHRPVETPRLAAIAFGEREEKSWLTPQSRSWVLHDLMGHVRDLAGQLGVSLELTRMVPSHPYANALHPGRRVQVFAHAGESDPVSLGWVAEFHPQTLRNFEIEGTVYGFELNLAEMLRQQKGSFRPAVGQYNVHKLPLVHRDFAFLLDEKVAGGSVQSEVVKAFEDFMEGEQKKSRLAQFKVFDIYRGENVPKGKKSLAFQICIEPLEETLSDAWIQKMTNTIIQSLQVHLGAELRG